MRNALNLFIAATLMVGTVSAQEESESIQRIMDELMNYTESPAPEPGLDALFMTEPEPGLDALFMTDLEPVLEPVAAPNLDFEQAAKLAPESIAARAYQRTLMERDQRTAEIEGLAAVDAAWFTERVLRPYALSSDACEKMGLEEKTTAVDVESLFPQVDFPKGSSAIYQPETKIIFVYNTAENLAVLEAILDATGMLKESAEVDQVEIEAKFVEVAEGTLEELGFQWNFDDPNSVGFGGANLEVSDEPGGLFSGALRGSPTGPDNGELPFSRLPLKDALASSIGWQTFRIQDTFNTKPATLDLSYRGEDAFDLLISALDQSTGADILSAPRIVTKSGEEATIRVGERHYFPEVYEGETSTATMLQVNYEDFEEKLLGIELSVTPEVDGNQITLGLNPRITELAGWQEYQLAPAEYITPHYRGSLRGKIKHDNPVIAKLPVFKKREIETEVTIADGGTIGMGGLISEKIEAFEDKVPVLGSIPLVGRLFRNEGERAVKRNLLMFVTARKVGPSGRINTSRSFD